MKSNLKPNKIIGALTLSLTVIGTPAFSAGIPTIDATAITQAIMTLEQLHREYEQLVKTYENQVKHFNAVTGIRDINRFINYGNKFTEFLPDNLKTSVQSLGKYGASAMTPEVRSLYNKFGMGDRCSRYTTRFQETCYARAAIDATRLYSSIAGAEGSSISRITNEAKKSFSKTRSASRSRPSERIRNLTARAWPCSRMYLPLQRTLRRDSAPTRSS